MNMHDYFKIVFVDRNPNVIIALANQFSYVRNSNLKFVIEDIFSQKGDTLVSPANSYGNMDGGIDQLYSQRFPGIENRLRVFINNYYNNRLEIGQAQIISTGDENIRRIIFAPTVERPSQIATKESVYLAAKAVFNDAILYNQKVEKDKIETLLMPGMGTLLGGLDVSLSAESVFMAYRDVNSSLKNK